DKLVTGVQTCALPILTVRAATAPANGAYAPPTIIAYMGDVNVQFPDNLLWKRRTMCLDSQGFLTLGPPAGSGGGSGGAVREKMRSGGRWVGEGGGGGV